jgi:enterochelin esterase family protein
MPGFPATPPFTRIGADTWFLRIPLPATARIEYRLAVRSAGHLVEIDDPLNPPRAANPFGNNSVLGGSGYRPAVFPSGEPGDITEVRVPSSALGGRRHHHVYLPAGFEARHPYPILLVHDGPDFLRYADLAPILDGLIEAGVIRPVVVVLLQPWDRVNEYAANQQNSRHLVAEVVPHLTRRLRLPPATELAVMGSSLGGVAALAAAWHFPNTIGAVASLSGSFMHRTDEDWPQAVFHPIVDFVRRLTIEPGPDRLKVFQSVGRYEGLCDYNRHLAPILRGAGATLTYVETWDGHHWGSWRDRLGQCLPSMLAGAAPSALKG